MNKYDIKYIIKKILIYSGVALILMFVKSCDIKALTTTATISDIGNSININQNEYTKNYYFTNGISQRPIFENGGEGNLIFSLGTHNSSSPVDQITQVTVGNNTNIFVCDIGTATTYVDSGFQRIIYSVNCPVNINSEGIRYVSIQREDYYGTLQVYIGQYATFISKDSVNVTVDQQAVTNAINQSTQQMIQQQQSTQQSINDIKDTINNDNVDNQQSSDFFNNFGSTTNQGLQDLIKKPIDIVDSFYNSCSPITFNIPYFDTTISLPCISSIQNDFTSVIFPIIRVIINGLLCYRILTRFIDEINKLKDPNNSDLEVVDL